MNVRFEGIIKYCGTLNCCVDFVAEELTTMEPKGGFSVVPVKLSDRF
jgi:hypothetical protein